MTPNFSAYPWHALPRLSRREAVAQSLIARWLAVCAGASSADATSSGRSSAGGTRLRKLLAYRRITPGSTEPLPELRGQVVVASSTAFDAFAARANVRAAGVDIVVIGSNASVRAIAQRVLGGPDELPAPRPLSIVEQSIWALVVASALEDLGVAGDVAPELGASTIATTKDAADTAATIGRPMTAATRVGVAPGGGSRRDPRDEDLRVGVDLRVGDIAIAAAIEAPPSLVMRAPPLATSDPMRPTWVDRIMFDLPIVVGRCAIHREDLARLAVRSLVTIERATGPGGAELEVFDGVVGIRAASVAGAAAHQGLGVEVVTGYVRRDMSLPDDAHVELTVGLGTTRLSLRQVTELAVGQIVSLGRPLAGPFELRAQGRVVGRGELVDVDGELAVRIVSLGD